METQLTAISRISSLGQCICNCFGTYLSFVSGHYIARECIYVRVFTDLTILFRNMTYLSDKREC